LIFLGFLAAWRRFCDITSDRSVISAKRLPDHTRARFGLPAAGDLVTLSGGRPGSALRASG